MLGLRLRFVAQLVFLSLLVARVPLDAEEPAAPEPDFKYQGEYIGVLLRDGQPELFGVQCIALGKGKFEAVGLRGGLPGLGWDRGAKIRFAGEHADFHVIMILRSKENPEALLLEVAPSFGGDLDHALLRDEGTKMVGRLERVLRKSPTLGQNPPAGAVVLFDGSSADGFRTARGSAAKMSEEKLLVVEHGSGGLFSRRPHAACKLHLEFRLPFEPTHRGQGRANSGCYLQGRHEVQILDSFGLEGKENECGGVYSSGKDPEVNMAFPPLSWQTFDIDFTPAAHDAAGKKSASARLTVRHNGVEIYHDLVIDHATTAAPSPEGPEPLPLYLQDHGHDIFFRNVWLVER